MTEFDDRLDKDGAAGADAAVRWRRYVALGDSFTEGLDDRDPADPTLGDRTAPGRYVGWADRVAAALAARDPEVRYANLAVRGKLLAQVCDEQVPAALALRPDLVSFAAGVNDALRRRWEPEPAAARLDEAVGALRGSGADVLLVAFGDPSRRSRVMGRVTERVRVYNTAVHDVAQRHGAMVVEFWGAAVFDDDVMWSPDRLHLSSLGHERAAGAALEALGLADESWRTPMPSTPPPSVLASAAGTARWTREHFVPWLVRRARGVSSGDGIAPKHPDWVSPSPLP